MFTSCGDSDDNDNDSVGDDSSLQEVTVENGAIKAEFSVSALLKI